MSQEIRPGGPHTGVAQEPAATIVVVARERFSYSRKSLESLYANTSSPFHLIYVDGGSPSHLKRYLEAQSKEKRFQLIRTEHYLSPNQARNIGQRAARTKYVVFVDNDVEVAPGWLSALLQCAEETDASLVGPLYCIGQPVHQVIHMAGGEASIRLTDGRRQLHENLRLCDQRVSEVLPQLRRECCELIEFHCLLARREVFQQLGPLDEGLLGTREHVDFCLKVREAGGEVWFEPNAVATHGPDSIWPEVPPPFAWSDIPYYLLRWSDDWGQRSLSHFERKWNLDAGSAELTTDWLRPHRQVPLRRLRMRLRSLLGAKRGDRLVDALEEFLASRAVRKVGLSGCRAASDSQRVEL
jgi:GT2 family glycosyltransferase